ncbi:hypothetical protein [uncultured Brachyspira sp.]|uniref:hypothetical protein n=3 Tax=uncultured Brachyspira sp. TaxID=221953 RepID=UPI0025E76FC7|nr:hypothetical protein [uncultured Brachyspira sp.]
MGIKSKFHNIFQKNKKFIIIYTAVILIIIISLLSLSILGNIQRTGYLSGFSKISDDSYSCKINYYGNKVFRHSDIYGVYPYFINNDYSYKANDNKGTPFGNLFTQKELQIDDKIDIQYKLRLKNNIVFLSFIFLILLPILYFCIKLNIIKYYILLFLINSFAYYIIPIILKQFSISLIRWHYADIILSYIFLITAFNLLNKKLLYTLLFEIINIFSFFIIEPLALTFQNKILLFRDIPYLYPALIISLPLKMKIITVTATIIYFSIIILLISLFVYNLIKMKRKKAVFITVIIFIFAVFFRKQNLEMWQTDFVYFSNKNGIINTINYRINYDRLTTIKHSKEDVSNAFKYLRNIENERNYSNLLTQNTINSNRDIFLIFLESFYDYSHFTNLFEKDPFPKEYRDWADNSGKIPPNYGGGSFDARLSGLTSSSPLTPKVQNKKNEYTLPHILFAAGYNTIALEEAQNTYNLKTFLPSIYFNEIVFELGTKNMSEYLSTNIQNYIPPIFVYGFTYLGHAGSHAENDFNIKKNNEKFFSHFENADNLIETMDNSVMTAFEVIKTKNIILEYSPNALIIFKHDHLYPSLRNIIENSSIDNDIKMSFLNDSSPNPILIWDGTNGAYKAPNNFVPENIPMFIALNAGITNYRSSVISLLYKEEIDGIISTYHRFYKVTNDALFLENDISKDSEIYKYENAQRILSQDIFQGKKYYYDLIKELTNN